MSGPMQSIEAIVICYVWGLISDEKFAELADVPVEEIGFILKNLMDKRTIFRALADGPAIAEYENVSHLWDYKKPG